MFPIRSRRTTYSKYNWWGGFYISSASINNQVEDVDGRAREEETAKEMYPGIGICPYIMTGGTDAKYYSEVSKNCIRFAPLYIDGQQYGSIHALNENIYQGTLPMGVDFYKNVVKKSR